MVLIDSLLPNIIAEIVRLFFTTSLNTIKELSNNINNKNPLNYDNQFSHLFYEYKIKRFLTDVALGMMPSKVWSGIYDATGGYLIVKKMAMFFVIIFTIEINLRIIYSTIQNLKQQAAHGMTLVKYICKTDNFILN